jgi:peroxiredoxin
MLKNDSLSPQYLFALACAAAVALSLFIPGKALGQSDLQCALFAEKDDRPIFTSFDITPTTLLKNKINLVTISFNFKDDKRNLRGGILNINFQFSNGNRNFVTRTLDEQVFKNKKGSFSLSFALLANKWKWVKISAWMRDSAATNGIESEWIQLDVEKKVTGERQGRKVGRFAYDFTLYDQAGKQVTLSDLRGKVVLLDICTMWCGPCRNEAAHLEDLYTEYKDDGLVIITVITENIFNDPPTTGDQKTWVRTYKLSFPVLGDPFWGAHFAYTGETSTKHIPWNFIIDRQGKLRWKKLGYLPNIAVEIENEIISLL